MGDLYPHSLTQDSSTESFCSISIKCGDCHGMFSLQKAVCKKILLITKTFKGGKIFYKLALTSNEANLSGYAQVL